MTELKAPAGQFRVVGLTPSDNTDWIDADLSTLDAAIAHAKKQVEGKERLKMFVYDDRGFYKFEAGRF